jgi:putative DNA primase/helicase
VDLETKIREDDPRQNVTAGQQVRLIDVPADAGMGLGLFETLHDYADARSMAEGLNRAAIANYGHAGLTFVELVSRQIDEMKDMIDAQMAKAMAALNLPTNADGQVARVAKKFMLVGVAGELAIKFGILPWPQGEAQRAASKLFGEWLENRGGVGASEEACALDQVRYYLQKNAYKFICPDKDEHEPKSAASMGFIKKVAGVKYFCFPAETWKREVCTGLDSSFVARVLQDHGYLIADDGRSTKPVDFAGTTVRVHAVRESILTVESKSSVRNVILAARNQLQKGT